MTEMWSSHVPRDQDVARLLIPVSSPTKPLADDLPSTPHSPLSVDTLVRSKPHRTLDSYTSSRTCGTHVSRLTPTVTPTPDPLERTVGGLGPYGVGSGFPRDSSFLRPLRVPTPSLGRSPHSTYFHLTPPPQETLVRPPLRPLRRSGTGTGDGHKDEEGPDLTSGSINL